MIKVIRPAVINTGFELLDLAVKAEVVQKAGAWFSYDGRRLGQGRDKVKELLKTDKELAAEIEKKLWENIDKLYERKKPAPKVKITEVPSANQEIKPDSADKPMAQPLLLC